MLVGRRLEIAGSRKAERPCGPQEIGRHPGSMLQRVVTALSGRPAVTIVDLACSARSTLRALALT